MAIFLGGKKNTSRSARCSKIHYAVTNIINPGYATVYTNAPYTVKHVIGIDNSELRAARIGVRFGTTVLFELDARLTMLPN